MKRFLIFLIFCIPFLGFTQNYASKEYYLIDTFRLDLVETQYKSIIDSCISKFHSSKQDTDKINAIYYIVDKCWDDKVWPPYNNYLYSFIKNKLKVKTNSIVKLKLQTELIKSINNKAYYFNQHENFSETLKSYLEALQLAKEFNLKKDVGEELNYIGLLYKYHGDISNALDYYHQSLKIRKELNDKEGIATNLNNIGVIYMLQDEIALSLKYFQESLKYRKEIDDKFGIAQSLNNIGYLYHFYGDPDCKFEKKRCKRDAKIKALDYYQRSLVIREEVNDKSEIAMAWNNIGSIYEAIGDPECALNEIECQKSGFQKALNCYLKSLTLREEAHDEIGVGTSNNNIGGLYLKKGDYNKAEYFLKRALVIYQKFAYPENIRNSSALLAEVYKRTNHFKEALDMYELHIKMRDSLNNIETQKAAIKQQTKYSYEQQKALDDKAHEFELKQNEEKASMEKTKQNIIIISVSVVLVIVALFSIFLYNRFKITQKQKIVIEQKEKIAQEQKEIIVEKHKEITDSINYAERIQRSFLATKELLSEHLTEYFIIFKPKDVVSGDFYWASKLNNGNFAFVTADSTGHGVPGAIMSLLNITSLEKAIEFSNSPSEILGITRSAIIDRLKKDGSEEGGKDGMDCSFMSFNTDKTKLEVASAHNPIWIIRNNELIEIIADKMPVGKHDRDQEPFTLHTFDIQKGDVVYSLTDGFPDQFGGPKGKKFMSKKLKELLLKISQKPIQEQYQILERAFSDWVGNLEQVDDVTLVGIKI